MLCLLEICPLVAVSVLALAHAVSMPVVPPESVALLERQVPEIAKQPAARLKPLAAVDVAAAPESARYVPVNPPVNVVVPVAPKVAAPEMPLKASAAVVEVARAELVAR